jgi:biotin synthase-related radical SAM superfamily protein
VNARSLGVASMTGMASASTRGDVKTQIKVRVSYGSAVVLGLVRGRVGVPPTALYILLQGEGCRGRCMFCPQSTGDPAHVSRVEWLEFPIEEVVARAKSMMDRRAVGRGFERICVQCTDEPVVREALPGCVAGLRCLGLPVSVSTPPLTREGLLALKGAGAETVTVPLDCADKEMCMRVKGRGAAEILGALREAVEVFGRGKVGTHIIVGMGEREESVVGALIELAEMGVVPSLFAFTPLRGTLMEGRRRPSVVSYRRLQLARHLIVDRGMRGGFGFGKGGRIISIRGADLRAVLSDGGVFTVRGCPGCNRPYYNERASGPLYNFPEKPEEQVMRRIAGEIIGSLAGD